MEQLPVFIRLREQDCLVVGGGVVAERKTALLLRTGARLTVAAPGLTARLAARRDAGELRHHAGKYQPWLLEGRRLVIAATDDRELNRRIGVDAGARGILCNVVDDYQASGFTLPAIVDRSPVVVAIGTGGNSPVLTQRLKGVIESSLPSRIAELARQAGRWRELVRRRFASVTERRRFWQGFFEGPAAAALLDGRRNEAERAFRRALIGPAETSGERAGEAYIVGAGPGDPGLVTLRARQLIGQADVVLYDRLVAPPIVDFARKEADLLAVGKGPGSAGMKQSEINALLVRLVREGKRVCRLKGGDPFVFGRGGEEAAALADAGLRFEIVPGVSAALGCAAYAGIPLTQRGLSASVTLATAARAGDRAAPDWSSLARPGQTLALYMSTTTLATTASGLIEHGLDRETPAALVSNGTTSGQRVLHATLERIAADAAAAGFVAPAMLFVGDTVPLGRKLRWFGNESAAAGFSGTAGVLQERTTQGARARSAVLKAVR